MVGLSHIYGRRAFVFAAVLVPTALAFAPADAAGTPARLRGSVVSSTESKLVVHAKDGKDISRQFGR